MNLKKTLYRTSFLFILLGYASFADAELKSIWAISGSEKIHAEDLEHPLATKNEVYDGKIVSLVAMRNEIISFQVILRGGAENTKNIRVVLSELGPIKNGDVSDDGDRYYLNRHIEIFEEHYVTLNSPSVDLVWKPWSDSQPQARHFNGSIPDALIPHRKPFDVRAKRNQGLWIDLYVNQKIPAGIYQGELKVLVDEKLCELKQCRLPIQLEVGDFVLPDEPSTKTMVYFSGGENDRNIMPARYFSNFSEVSKTKVDQLRSRHFKLARRHRLTFFIGTAAKPDRALSERLKGNAFSEEQGYYGPGMGVAQDLYSIFTYGVGKLDSKSVEMWRDYFKKTAPKTTYFYYAKDEPQSDTDFDLVNRLVKNAKPIKSFVTTKYRSDLDVDIFCAGTNDYSIKDRYKAKAKGKELWIYNGRRPFAGTFVMDDVAVATRVNPWIQYKYQIPRWFFWEATYYRDFQGDRGNIDIFSQANNFRNAHGDRMNGDGLLVYPGRDHLFKLQDREFDFPLPSVRLKNWRRGIQDVEYLILAKKKGHHEFVKKLVQIMVPKALKDETKDGDPVSWPEDGERWVRARKLLFKLLKTGNMPQYSVDELARPKESSYKRAKRWLKRVLDPFLRSPKRRKLSLLALGVGGIGFLFIVVLFVRRRRAKKARGRS